jgi:hypothetical protein
MTKTILKLARAIKLAPLPEKKHEETKEEFRIINIGKCKVILPVKSTANKKLAKIITLR